MTTSSAPTSRRPPRAGRLAERRRRVAATAAQARVRVAADEIEAAGRPRRAAPSLAAAWCAFWRHPSPWLLGCSLAAAGMSRPRAGAFGAGDAVVPLVLVLAFPFVEWVAHVVVLHWRPRRIGPVTVDPLLARSHREHHADPRDIPLVFIPWRALVWLLGAQVAIGLVAFPRAGVGLTYLFTISLLGLAYEWTHYLIHSDYRPRTAAYRAIWRNHRLHHYKNERYWFTVTTARTADRVLGTAPDPADVPTSPTARALHRQVGAR